MKKGIEFADETWNPVWGCLNDCRYCYAKPIAKRFASNIALKENKHRRVHITSGESIKIYDSLKSFYPILIKSQLEKKFKKKTTHVFVNSMSDIMYWEVDWMIQVREHLEKYPDKKFIFFTKAVNLSQFDWFFKVPNMVLVRTINTNADAAITMIHEGQRVALCFEPIQEEAKVLTAALEKKISWVIVGGETGNRKGKIDVRPEWLKKFYDLKIPVFMKESVRHLVPENKFRQERI